MKLNKIYNISYITAGGIDFAIFIFYNFFLTYYAFQTPKYFGIHIIVYSESPRLVRVCKNSGWPTKSASCSQISLCRAWKVVVVYTVCPKTLPAAVSEVVGGVAREKGRVWGHVAAVATQWAPRSICTYIILYVVLLVCARHKKGLCGAWSPSVAAAAAAKYNQTNVQC